MSGCWVANSSRALPPATWHATSISDLLDAYSDRVLMGGSMGNIFYKVDVPSGPYSSRLGFSAPSREAFFDSTNASIQT